MSRIFIICFILLLASSGVALAEEGFTNQFYAGVSRGVSDVSNTDIVDKENAVSSRAEFKRDLFASAVVGLDIGRGRYELELDYRQSDLDRLGSSTATFSGDVTVTSLMFNVYGDFENDSRYTPYLGFGLGAAKISINDWKSDDTDLINDTDYLLAFQVATGVHIAINQRWGIDFGYKYFNTAFPDFTDAAGRGIESDFRSNTLALGARYYFP